MKRVLLLALSTLLIGSSASVTAFAQAGKKKPTTKKTANSKSNTEINWLSLDEIQERMAKEPRKVYMDVYTDWCGWCKKMDVGTFTNPDVVRYMNANFYAFKFNAERQDTITLLGKKYYYKPEYKANTLAVELLKGQMGYPTSVFFLENFQSPNPISGYHGVKEMEMFLTYFGDNTFKHKAWDAFQKDFKPTWKEVSSVDMSAPAGH